MLLALAHGQQRLLQMARQARGVKQRAGAALLVQALAQGGQQQLHEAMQRLQEQTRKP